MREVEAQKIIALAGNPNVGKSTLFNALTGMHQHTGNWPGKTVGKVTGTTVFRGKSIELVDLPGTYSLTGNSEDEQIAAEYINGGEADCIVAVCDGSSLERTMVLALQILRRTKRMILCINLMDEASRRGIRIDAKGLEKTLGIPVILTAAGRKQGLDNLLEQVLTVQEQTSVFSDDDPLTQAEMLTKQFVSFEKPEENWRLILDRVLISRRHGVPVLAAILLLIIWLTVWGANYPSQMLELGFRKIYEVLKIWTSEWPGWLSFPA